MACAELANSANPVHALCAYHHPLLKPRDDAAQNVATGADQRTGLDALGPVQLE